MGENSLIDPLYQVKADCVNCGHSFQTSRVRPSFKKGTGRDTDFCIHYKDPEINPDYYVVRVCPYCGFASTENFSDKMTDAQRQLFKDRVAQYWSMTDYGGKRSREDAMKTLKLALLCAQIKQESDRVIAGILHHIAWLYRYMGDTEQEDRFLQFALDAYIKVYETEGVSLNNAKLMYLIGELHRRLKRYNEAVKWFSRVVNDKKIMDAAMIQASREMWQTIREDMLEDQSNQAK